MPHRARALAALLSAVLFVGCGHGHHQAPKPDASPTATATSEHASPVATVTPGPTGPAGELDSSGAEIDQLRDTTPDDVPPVVLERADEAEAATADRLDLPPANDPNTTGGAQLNPCVDHTAQTRRSSYGAYRGIRSIFGTVLHETIGPNVPGIADVAGTAGYLNRVGLSASDIMDFEGNCWHTVPYTYNPYTQGPFNEDYDSLEIVATGRETRAQWLAAPIFKRHILANYLLDRLKARGVPLRLVDPIGCTAQAGYTDHHRLECTNNHTDQLPGFPFDVLARQLHDGIWLPPTKGDRRDCRRALRYHRRNVRGVHTSRRYQRARIDRLHKHGWRCQRGHLKPRRR